MGEKRTLTRRSVLASIAAGTTAGVANSLSDSGEEGNLYGGTMALSEAYNVAGSLWIGPKTALTEVSPESGRVFMASDAQVEYHGDGDSWVKMGIGSESDPVPEVHSEWVSTGQASIDDHINHPGNVGTNRDGRRSGWARGRTLAAFEDIANDWTQDLGTVEGITSDTFRGQESLRLAATNGVARADKYLGTHENIAGKSFAIAAKWVTGTDGADTENPITLKVQFRDENSNWKRYRRTVSPRLSNEWWMYDLRFEDKDSGFDPTEVEEIIVLTSSLDEVEVHVDSLKTIDRPSKGLVVVSFDDVYTDDLKAWDVFGEYDIPLTFLVNGGFVGETVAGKQRLTMSELQSMYDEGACLINHGLEHKNWDAHSAEEFREDVRLGKEWLIQNGFRRGSHLHGWGAGQYNTKAIDIVGDYHYGSALAGSGAVSGGPVSMFSPFIHMRVSFEGSTGMQQAKDMISKAAQEGEVAHVFGHTYNSTESEWREIASHIASEDVIPVTFAQLHGFNDSEPHLNPPRRKRGEVDYHTQFQWPDESYSITSTSFTKGGSRAGGAFDVDDIPSTLTPKIRFTTLLKNDTSGETTTARPSLRGVGGIEELEVSVSATSYTGADSGWVPLPSDVSGLCRIGETELKVSGGTGSITNEWSSLMVAGFIE